MKRFVFLCSLAMPCLASDDAGWPVNFQRAFFSEKSSKSRLTPVNACILRHINFKLASLPVGVSQNFASTARMAFTTGLIFWILGTNLCGTDLFYSHFYRIQLFITTGVLY
jgi:hypothetical protein